MAKSKSSKSKPAPKKAAKPISKKVAKPAPKKATKSVTKPAPKKVAKPVAKKVAKPAPKKVAKPVAKKVAKPAPKKVVKPVAKKVAKPAPKKVVKPVAKKVAKPAPKKVAKPVAKKVAKPAPKKVVKPVAKKVAKPAPKKVVKPVAKKVAKPAPKKVVKPVAKKVAKPAPKIASKPIVKVEIKKVGITPKKVKAEKPKRVIKENLPAKALIIIDKPSTKDEPKQVLNVSSSLRFSDSDLKEFKAIIDSKLVNAREQLSNLKGSLDSHTDSQEGNKAWSLEEGSDTSEMEYLMNQMSRQNKFIRDLEMALVRIENKTYGICRATGKLISKERLRIVPHATLSIDAKLTRKSDDALIQPTISTQNMGSEGTGFGLED